MELRPSHLPQYHRGMDSVPNHNAKGNCWTAKAVVDNPTCTCPLQVGKKERYCFLCHQHGLSRGFCTHCPDCEACARRPLVHDDRDPSDTMLSTSMLLFGALAVELL